MRSRCSMSAAGPKVLLRSATTIVQPSCSRSQVRRHRSWERSSGEEWCSSPSYSAPNRSSAIPKVQEPPAAGRRRHTELGRGSRQSGPDPAQPQDALPRRLRVRLHQRRQEAQLTHPAIALEALGLRHELLDAEPAEGRQGVHGRERLVLVEEASQVARRPQRGGDQEPVDLADVGRGEAPLAAGSQSVAQAAARRAEGRDRRDDEVVVGSQGGGGRPAVRRPCGR